MVKAMQVVTVHNRSQAGVVATVRTVKSEMGQQGHYYTWGGHPQQMDVHRAIPSTEEDDVVADDVGIPPTRWCSRYHARRMNTSRSG